MTIRVTGCGDNWERIFKGGKMKTRYEYIHFVQDAENAWVVRNNKTEDSLGMITWYLRWRQFCLLPYPEIVFSKGCLLDIIDFIGQLPLFPVKKEQK